MSKEIHLIHPFKEALEQDRKFKEFCEEEMRKIKQAFGDGPPDAFEASRRETQKHFFDDLYAQLKAQS